MSESTKVENKIRDENLPPSREKKSTSKGKSSTEERPKKRKKKVKSSSSDLKSQGSKYRGVCRNRDKWQAVIWVQGKRKYLGTFKDENWRRKRMMPLLLNIEVRELP